MISRSGFGHLPSGEEIDEYTLINTQGAILKIITYGGIITQLHVPDSKGCNADVVLGFSNLAGYLAKHPYIGAIIGRVAGRITAGKFSLEGKNYHLAINDPPNHLHGGFNGFDKRVWKAGPLTRNDGAPSLQLKYRSVDGEEGYPGDVDVAVTYTLSAENEVIMEYEAKTTKATPLSLTNHSYFNLAGEGSGTVKDHILQILTHDYVPTNEEMTLQGRIESVLGKANDFTAPQRIGDALTHLLKNHGDNYLFSGTTSGLRPIAKVMESQSKRMLEVFSTEPCLQFYSGVYLDGTLIGKSGKPYGAHAGFCLECQGYPDGVNSPEIGDIILMPGETYRQTTIYKFSTKS